MNITQIDWRLWTTFLAVMENQSLSGAARYLSMTQPTVGRHIDTLETALNATLFTRSKAGLSPTALSRTLLPNVRLMANTAATLKRQAANAVNKTPSIVRITASQIVGTELLPNTLREFRQLNSQIELEINITNELLNLPQRSADIAIRMTRPTQNKLVAKKIRDANLGLYASAEYIKKRGKPKHLEALFEYDLIGYDQDQHRLSGMKLGNRALTPGDFSIRCDNDVTQLAALRAGLGIGVCHAKIAKRDGLQSILASNVSIVLPIWLVMHEDLRHDPDVRAVFDHLARTV